MTEITVISSKGVIELSLQGSTSIKYAAARVADEFGYKDDGKLFYWLATMSGQSLPEDEIIASYENQTLYLVMRGR